MPAADGGWSGSGRRQQPAIAAVEARTGAAVTAGGGGSLGCARKVRVRLLEAQGLRGKWNEGVWSFPSPICKPVEQLNGHGSRRVNSRLISLL